MASSLIGQLRILLGLETSQLEAGSRQAKKSLLEIGDAAKTVKGLISTMFTAFAITAMKDLVERSLEHVEALGLQAKALGTTTQQLQEYKFATGQAGVSSESFNRSIAKLSKSLGDARNGAAAPQKAFAELSKIIGHDLTAGSGDVLKILPDLSDALTKIIDPTRRNSIEAALLGRGYRDMAPFLALGAEKINALRKSAEDLGIVLSNAQIQGAEETAHKLKALHDVLGARIDGAVASNAKAIYGFADAITSVAIALAKFWGQNPKLAMGLVGAAAGASIGRAAGGWGALAGAVGGFALGEHLGGDTPESLRAKAFKYRTTAQMQGRALGYYSPGASPEKQKAILGAPGVGDNLRTYHQLLAQADALERSQAISLQTDPAGTATPGQFLKGGGRKHGDHAEARAKEAERVKFELDKEELEGKKALIAAQGSLTNDFESRADFAKQAADLDLQGKQLSIQHDLQMVLLDKTISEPMKEQARLRAKQALVLADNLHVIDLQRIVNDRELERQRNAEALTNAQFDARRELLDDEEKLATTAAERRKIELELLDLAYEQKRLTLEHIRNDLKPNGEFSHTDAERALAAVDLANLDKHFALQRQGVMQGTAGPLEQLSRSIPDTAERMNEAFKTVAAEGLQDLNDGLAQSAASFIKLGGVAGDVLRKIYAEVIKLLMARYLEKPAAGFLDKLLGGLHGLAGAGAGLGGASPDFGTPGAGLGGGSEIPIPDLPAFAGGGSLMIGGMAGVDANLLSINGMPAARVNQGERLDIVPANDTGGGGRGGAYYDMRGSFLTKELFDYIDGGDLGATFHGGALGAAGAMSNIRRAAARAIPTGGRR